MFANELNTSVFPNNENDHPPIHIQLKDEHIWTEFNHVTLENIVTFEGRRLFPSIQVSIENLQRSATYDVYVDLIERGRYAWTNNQWIERYNNSSTSNVDNDESVQQRRAYLHKDSPNLGSFWMANPVSFARLKLTLQTENLLPNQITVKPMHMYVPRIRIVQRQLQDEDNVLVHSQTLPLATFIVVTRYRSEEVTLLKIRHNPYAQDFLLVLNQHLPVRSYSVAG